MKKFYLFFFAMLAGVTASAQSTVQITPVSATYTSTPTVQFKVSWTNQTTDNHRNKVWIFLDFQTVVSPTQKGNWQPATITGTVQKTAGTVSEQSNRGFFLEGTTTNFSSTVTVQLSNISTPFNWCAYGSDYPPNVTLEKGTYTFKGTTNFIVSNPAQTLTTKTIAKSNLTVNSSTMFTDATGCPGIGSLYCPYTGIDLYMDASHLCQQRTSGAKNWEAWIKDIRDEELYRIVLMPDNKWWLAQNVKYAGAGYPNVGCTPDECGRAYPNADVRQGSPGGNVQGICPPGWLLPVNSDWTTLVNKLGNGQSALAALRVPNSPCGGATNAYGFADIHGVCYPATGAGTSTDYCVQWYSWNGTEDAFFWMDCGLTCNACDGNFYWTNSGNNRYKRVRCFRTL